MFAASEEFEIEGIKFSMTGDHFRIAGRGDVYTAHLLQSYTSKEVGKINGKQIKDGIITGIEMFSTFHQNVGRSIGLLIRKIK